MYEDKLIFIILTWVWIKFNFQLEAIAGPHVQRQTIFYRFDLSSTKILFPTRNNRWTTCSKANIFFIDSTWVRLEFYFQLETNAGPHVQSQTRFFGFDLSSTKILFPARTKTLDHMCKEKLIFIILTWVWLNFNFQLETSAGTHAQRQTLFYKVDLSLTRIQFFN